MVLAPIVALGAALRWSRWPLTDAEPFAEDSAILQALMNAGHGDRVEFMARHCPTDCPTSSGRRCNGPP